MQVARWKQRTLVILCSALAVSCAAMPKPSPVEADRLARINESLAAFVARGERAGLVWAVAQDGEIVGYGAHGQANVAANQAMALDSIFRIYSMTRAVTAVAVLQLAERRLVALDSPVSRYLPQLASLKAIDAVDGEVYTTRAAARPITVRDLLTYTSGFAYAPQYPASVGVDHRGILALDRSMGQAMTLLSTYPLRDQPGARWRYGYHSDVLGALVETVAGQRLDLYFRDNIFAPLGMNDTGFVVPPEKLDRLVRAYDGDGNDITDRLPPSSGYTRETSFHSGGGGLVSTAPDWVRFAGMLANDGELDGVRILSRSTARALRRNQLTSEQGPLFWYDGADTGQPGFSPRFVGYGFGYSIGVRLDTDDHTIPGRAGEITWGGLASTNWFADPETGLVALVFAQYLGADSDDTDAALRRALYE